MTRYVIVGSGVAGVTAMETLRQADPSCEIVAVSEDPHGFYSRPGLAYYLSDEIPRQHLTLYSRHDWKALHARHIQSRAIGIDAAGHKVAISKMGVLGYDRLLLATGSTAVPLNVPGAKSKGVVKLDSLEDARHILSLARQARTAVVVGGGVIALELAEGLASRGVKVHYFMRGSRYWSNVLDETESHLIEARLAEEGILIHPHTEIEEVLTRGGRVKAVRTKQGEILPCGMVAVGVGVRPRADLALSAGLKTERGILVNEYLQTSAADVFAAGDAAQIFDPATNSSVVETLWFPARKQAYAAALNMTGKKRAYTRDVAINAVRLAGVILTIIGAVGSGQDEDVVSVTRGSSETWLQLPNTIATESGNTLNHVRIMVGETTLLGAVIVGEQKLSVPLQQLITRQVDISPIRSQLLQPEASLGHILMDYWTAWGAARSA